MDRSCKNCERLKIKKTNAIITGICSYNKGSEVILEKELDEVYCNKFKPIENNNVTNKIKKNYKKSRLCKLKESFKNIFRRK